MESPSPHNPDPDWMLALRERLSGIAARRVPHDVVEDLVQDTLGIVLAKGAEQARREGTTTPSVRWCFLVLRNVIGNWYQKRREYDGLAGVELADERPDPLAALAAAEKARTIRAAVQELRLEKPDCANWLWAVAEGAKAGELAQQARMEQAAFYRRLYRCRRRLAEILKGMGVAP